MGKLKQARNITVVFAFLALFAGLHLACTNGGGRRGKKQPLNDGGPTLSLTPYAPEVNVGESLQFSASGGLAPYSYLIVSGAGTLKSETGEFTAGAFSGSVKIKVTDSDKQYGETVITVYGPLDVQPPAYTVAAPQPGVAPGPTSRVRLSIEGAKPPCEWSTLEPDQGTFVSDPEDPTNTCKTIYQIPGGLEPPFPVAITVRAKDSLGFEGRSEITIQEPLLLHGIGPKFTPPPSPSDPLELGAQRTIELSATGGVPPYRFSIAEGSGSLNTSSKIFAAGKAPGKVLLQVKDSLGNISTRLAMDDPADPDGDPTLFENGIQVRKLISVDPPLITLRPGGGADSSAIVNVSGGVGASNSEFLLPSGNPYVRIDRVSATSYRVTGLSWAADDPEGRKNTSVRFRDSQDNLVELQIVLNRTLQATTTDNVNGIQIGSTRPIAFTVSGFSSSFSAKIQTTEGTPGAPDAGLIRVTGVGSFEYYPPARTPRLTNWDRHEEWILVSDGSTPVPQQTYVRMRFNQGPLVIGSNQADIPHGMAIDPDGNIYVYGQTFGNLGNQTNQGNGDGFIQKINTLGAREWAVMISGPQQEVVTSAYVDRTGVYVTGYYTPAGAEPGDTECFVSKYSPNGGAPIFRERFGTSGAGMLDECLAITLDAGGTEDLYVVGRSYVSAERGTDIYMLKLDREGRIRTGWPRYDGSSGNDQATAVATRPDPASTGQLVYVAGTVAGKLPKADFDVYSGQADVFASQYQFTGNDSDPLALTPPQWRTLWQRQTGSSGADSLNRMTLDDSGSVFLAGSTAGPSFVSTPVVSSATASFVIQFPQDGGLSDPPGLIRLSGFTADNVTGAWPFGLFHQPQGAGQPDLFVLEHLKSTLRGRTTFTAHKTCLAGCTPVKQDFADFTISGDVAIAGFASRTVADRTGNRAVVLGSFKGQLYEGTTPAGATSAEDVFLLEIAPTDFSRY